MSFRRIHYLGKFHYFQEFPAENYCFLEGKHCWPSRRKWLLPSPFSSYKVVVAHAHAHVANWSPHSHHTAQKVCVCYSPVSKMRVLVPGREEQLMLSVSTKELHLELIQLLVICPAAPCIGLGVYRTGDQKKGAAHLSTPYTLPGPA